jgi:hypothetical protein
MIKRALPILALAALFASTNLTVNAQSKGDQARWMPWCERAS